MTTVELACLVKEMRDAQKRYFETRDGMILKEAKALERKVDQAVARLIKQQGWLLS